LLAVEATTELPVIAVTVAVIVPAGAIGAIRSVGTIWSIWPVRARSIRTVRSVRPVGTIRPIWTIWPVRTIRSVWPVRAWSIWTIRSVRAIRARSVGTVRSVRAWLIWTIRSIRAWCVRTRSVRALGPFGAGFLRDFGRGPLGASRAVAATKATVFPIDLGLGVLRHGRQGGGGWHGEGSDRGRHQQ
jgi:hypothetical protein